MKWRMGFYFLLGSVLPGLGYQFVQDNLRHLGASDPSLAMLLGIAPNLLGGLSMASGLAVIAFGMRAGLSRGMGLWAGAASATLALWAWQGAQIVLPRMTFDPADLAVTPVGALAAVVLGFAILPRR